MFLFKNWLNPKRMYIKQTIWVLCFFLFSLLLLKGQNNSDSINNDKLYQSLSLFGNFSFLESAQINLEAGNQFVLKNKNVRALVFFNRAIQYADKYNDLSLKADITIRLADIYYSVNNYEKALQYYISALHYYSTNSKIAKITGVLDNISNIYLDSKMYSNALSSLFMSRKFYLSHEGEYKEKLMINSMNIGVAYGQIEQLDSSLIYFKLALGFAEKLDSQIIYGGILNNIGAVYSKLDSNALAMEYYDKALTCFEEIRYEKGIGISLGNIGYIFQKQGKYSKAVKYLLESIHYLVHSKAYYQLLNTYQNIGDTYKELGNYAKAVEYNEKYLELENRVSLDERAKKLVEIELQYKINQKNNEIKILEQENLIIEKENKIKQIKQYFYIWGIILLLALGFLLIRNMRVSVKNIRLRQELLISEKQQLTTELKLKNKDIENYAFRIVEKNKFLEGLNKEITFLHGTDEDIKRLMNISNSIRNALNIDNETLELENQINAVYDGFLGKLDERFPTLTKTEKRFCSLMILGLSSKEIAIIMNITSDSVKKSRHRLRKKLDLKSEEDIIDFLKYL